MICMMLTCILYLYMYFKCTFICLQTRHPHICTEPTGFIIAIGSDPAAYEGSQISLPPPDKLWYKRNDGGSGEGNGGKDGTDGGAGERNDGKDGTDGGADADDDQSLKTPSPLPPAFPSLPRADPHWYKLRDESKGSEAMEICSMEGGTEKDQMYPRVRKG